MTATNEAPRVHNVAWWCGGCMATRGRRAAMARGSTGNAMKGMTEWLASIGLSAVSYTHLTLPTN